MQELTDTQTRIITELYDGATITATSMQLTARFYILHKIRIIHKVRNYIGEKVNISDIETLTDLGLISTAYCPIDGLYKATLSYEPTRTHKTRKYNIRPIIQ